MEFLIQALADQLLVSSMYKILMLLYQFRVRLRSLVADYRNLEPKQLVAPKIMVATNHKR